MTRRQALGTIAAGAVHAQQDVEATASTVSARTVRICVQPGSIAADGALVRENWGTPMRLRGTVKSGELSVTLAPSPLTIRVEAKGGRVVQELRIADGKIAFRLDDRPVLGMGAGGPQFDRRGNVDRMVSGQGGYRLGTHGGKVPIQLVIGTSGWAMFLHQPLGAFDLTGKEGIVKPAAALPLDVFVMSWHEPAEVLAEYAKITGYPEMPPLWSFGYQQSHRTLGPPQEIVEEARTFRRKGLPCDAMIYLGTDFCPNGWNTHNGEFEWNAKAFPDPKRAIEELHAENMKVVLHTVIEGRHVTGTVADACTAAPLPSGRTPDGRWPPDRQASCYWPSHKPLFDLGVDGWWPDQGDGLDAPSRLARNRMYFDGHQTYRPNERVYALHRNGYAGMQRYASFLWSGDVQSTWETLKTHVPAGINAGLSGIPYWGTDIAGFIPTRDLTGELYVRWFQFAAFCPLFRSHGRNWRLRLPWGWNTGEMGVPEVANYNPDPAELHNPAVEPVCKKFLELRYRLMPYLYSAVKETCETGIPIIRALWLHYPDDAAAVARGDQYLFGRDLLVAPVVEKGATSRTVYLPKGVWHDFWTQERIEGGHEVTRNVDLATIPLYVRAGAVIPMGPVKQHTGEKSDAPLTIWAHPGADGAFPLYEDDGRSFDFRKGAFTRVNFSWHDRSRRLTIRSGTREERRVVVKVSGESSSREAVIGGSTVEVRM